ncbi:hypothetical protein TNCV_4204901 [Trichonephila clavipes]|nr:hypothetical protein TNCV_4204901 [Trichonephila clavipes]
MGRKHVVFLISKRMHSWRPLKISPYTQHQRRLRLKRCWTGAMWTTNGSGYKRHPFVCPMVVFAYEYGTDMVKGLILPHPIKQQRAIMK